MRQEVTIILVMGVSGTGKTTIGKKLAAALNWKFVDADSFHSTANLEKMSQGIPLNDSDRIPWLKALQTAIEQWLQADQKTVLACSSLKTAYRQMLWRDPQRMQLVYLRGTFEVIAQRLAERQNHFMSKDLLQSQFDSLEEPNPATSLWVEVLQSPDAIVQEIIQRL
jgi:gluconokinase